MLETDASGTAVGAVLSQANRPIAFLLRTLMHSEQKQSAVEREAMAIMEAVRKWNQWNFHFFPTLIKTDQKAVTYIFSKQKSKIKNDKLAHWCLELSELYYDVIDRKGSKSISADTMSRCAAISPSPPRLVELHNALCHSGITWLWQCIQRHIPFSISELREVTASYQICLECKP